MRCWRICASASPAPAGPVEIPGAAWDYGANLAYLKDLVDYWRTQFDWRAQEAALNRFAHCTTLDGMGIHFIHERGKGSQPLPLIITHGWPSTVSECRRSSRSRHPASHGGDPADAFDVVRPSMPGYGFSDHATSRPGINIARIADLWAQLMTESWLSALRCPGAIGARGDGPPGFCLPKSWPASHRTCSAIRPMPAMPKARRRAIPNSWKRQRLAEEETGYSTIQGTKPQTLAYGLNDSPAGWPPGLSRSFAPGAIAGGR